MPPSPMRPVGAAAAAAAVAGDDDASLPPPRGHALWARARRQLWLLALVGCAFVAGPPLSRLLSSYRAVVLEVGPEGLYVAETLRPPRWVPGAAAAVLPGAVVVKARGAWCPAAVPRRGRDFKLVQLFERYSDSYEATIARIDAPVGPGQPAVAVVDTDAHRRLRVPLWAEHLATAAAGLRLRKVAGSWDPVLVEAAAPAPAPGAP